MRVSQPGGVGGVVPRRPEHARAFFAAPLVAGDGLDGVHNVELFEKTPSAVVVVVGRRRRGCAVLGSGVLQPGTRDHCRADCDQSEAFGQSMFFSTRLDL